MNAIQPSAIFVYGTLKRGQCRESMWPVRPIRVREAFVFGRLFGRPDYPALMPGGHRVCGELWEFTAADMDAVLTTLDQIEGTNQPNSDDLYHRVTIEVLDVRGRAFTEAYTYHYANDPLADGFASIEPVDETAYVAWPAGE